MKWHRYGEYSKAGEFVANDHPFQWFQTYRSHLAREGGKYPDSWHYNHMMDPIMSPVLCQLSVVG